MNAGVIIRRRLAWLWLAAAALLLIAAQTAPGSFGSLEEVLIWVAVGGGAMALWGYIQAYLLENVPAWHGLPHWVKVLVPIVIAGVFGIAAEGLLALDLLAYVPPAVKAVLLAAINWIFSQRAYKGIKASAYAASARGE